jgi:dTDP-glucose 4,6-dehydratase
MKVINEGKQGEAYNIGSEYYLPNVEVAKKLLNILKLDDSRMVYVEDRPGHDFRYAVNIDKLKHLGWAPKSNFDQELEKIVAWYIGNKNWWLDQYEEIVSTKRKKRMGLL